jgi:transcriptional antiterminator RfaH
MNWYAVNTKPHQENSADLNLQRLNVETFFPLLKKDKTIRRKKQTVIEPLFPGYLFARFSLDTHYRAVHYARGVSKVVGFGMEPATVDEGVIESIKSRLQDGYITMQPLSLVPGEVVQIQEGPFKGLEAVFEREMGDCQRVVLLLHALSYQASLIVDLQQVVH